MWISYDIPDMNPKIRTPSKVLLYDFLLRINCNNNFIYAAFCKTFYKMMNNGLASDWKHFFWDNFRNRGKANSASGSRDESDRLLIVHSEMVELVNNIAYLFRLCYQQFVAGIPSPNKFDYK